MKDLIRIVLVDPNEESRNALQRLLGGIGSIWLAEVLTSYQEAADRAGEIAAHVTIVVLDHDPNQAIELIQKLDADRTRGTVVLPASRSADSGLILKAIRAGAREFLTLPAEQAELLERSRGWLRGRNESNSAADAGPADHHGHRRRRRRRLHHARRQPGRSPGRRQGTGDHPARSRPDLRRRSTPVSTSSRTIPCPTCFRTSNGST